MHSSTNSLSLPIVAALLVSALSANAAIIATEYFNDYGTTDQNMNGLGDWVGSGGLNDNEYRAGASLSYSASGYDNSGNLSGATHGAAGYDTNNVGAAVAVLPFSTTATTVWFSALVNRGNDTGHSLLWIDSDVTVSGGVSQDFIGLLSGEYEARYNNVTTTFNTLVTADTTFLILGKAELNVSGINDRLTFWFNPTLTGGEGGLGTATFTDDTADVFGDAIDGIGVQTSFASLIDAVRVGTTFADVVPEPSSAALVVLSGACLLLRRRRR